jgi:peptidoglycan/LPS O-acetylase OafA/YrhL
LFDPIIFEFFAGMIAARIFSSAKPDLWYVPMIAAAVGVLLLLCDLDWHRAMLAVVIAPAVLSAVMAEERFRLWMPPQMLLVGAGSYAIYLVHNPLQSLVARLLQGWNSWPLTFVACTVSGVIVGLCYHLAYERPALRWLSISRQFWATKGRSFRAR